MATLTPLSSLHTPKTLSLPLPKPPTTITITTSWAPSPPLHLRRRIPTSQSRPLFARAAAVAGPEYSKKSGTSEERAPIILPGCDYNHWLIVMEFPKDPAPTRDQMIETYLETLATVLGSMEEAKKNMYAFSTTTYTGFQCTVDEATSEKFKGLPGVIWVLPDSYLDVKNKDYGGDKYVNGEIIPCTYPTYQPNKRNNTKYESRRYERRRTGPPPQRKPQEGATSSQPNSE